MVKNAFVMNVTQKIIKHFSKKKFECVQRCYFFLQVVKYLIIGFKIKIDVSPKNSFLDPKTYKKTKLLSKKNL